MRYISILAAAIFFVILFSSTVLAQTVQLPSAGGSYTDPATGNTVYRLTDKITCPGGSNHVYSDTFEANQHGFIIQCRYDTTNLNKWKWQLIAPDKKTVLFDSLTITAKAPNVPYNFGELQWMFDQKRILGRNSNSIYEFDPWNGKTTLYVQLPAGCFYDWRVAPNGNIVARSGDRNTMCIFDGTTTRTLNVGAIASNPDQTSMLLDGRPLFTWNKNPHRAWNPDLTGEIIFDDFHGHLGQFYDQNGVLYTVDGKEDRLTNGGVGQIGCPGIAWRPEEGIYNALNGSRVMIWGCDQPAGNAQWDRNHWTTVKAVNKFASSGSNSIALWTVDWNQGKVTRQEIAKVHQGSAGYWGTPRATATPDLSSILFASAMCDGQVLETDGTTPGCGDINVHSYVADTGSAPQPQPGPQPANDTTPPNVYGGSPSADLSAGTTSTQISVTTNDAVMCKYSTTANTPYSSMTNTMVANGNSFAANVSGLADGKNYTYYMKCIDAAGNANTNDYAIRFSVSVSQPGSVGRPVSDITTGWTGTAASYWSAVDETTPDDNDFIRTGFSTGTEVAEVRLSPVLTPYVKTGHILRIRANTDDGSNATITSSSILKLILSIITKTTMGNFITGAQINGTGNTLAYELLQGSNVIASSTHSLPTFPTWATDSFTLTAAQASLITNYSDLRVRLTGNAVSNRIFVSWIEFEVPQGSGTTTIPSSGGSGGGSGGGGGGGSGGGGGGAIISQTNYSLKKITPKESKIVGGFNPEVGVKEIKLDVNSEVQNLEITVTKYEQKPADVSVEKTGKVYQYIHIDAPDLENKLKEAKLEFKVEKLWLAENRLKKDNIEIYKFDEFTGNWNKLAINYAGDDDKYHYYTTELNSLSYFVIVAPSGSEKEKMDSSLVFLIVLGVLITFILMVILILISLKAKSRKQQTV